MKRILLLIVVGITLISCSVNSPKMFSDKALNDVFITLDGAKKPFKNILEEHKGEKILVDVWASWCSDCLKSLPELKKIQQDFPDVQYMYLSLDRNQEDWKFAVNRLQLKGSHYFMQSGWEGDFGSFLNLNWIPRFLIVDEKGEITLFKATKSTDKLIRKTLINNVN